jgi:hypothetical protein
MHLKEIGWEDVDCVDLDQNWDRWRTVVNSVLSLPVPRNARNFLIN